MAALKIGDARVFDGKTFHLLDVNLTRAEVNRKATWMRRGQFSTRIVKVGRGNWQLWSR